MKRQNELVVLITGASSGIGQACAVYLAQRDYRVFGTSRSASARGSEVVQKAGVITMLRMDVNRNQSVKQGIRQVLRTAGRIDVVVNCAGFGIAGAVEDTSINEAKAQLGTNLFGAWRVCREVIPIMRRQGGGCIVNISSIGGRIGIPFQAAYSASKFGLEGLSEALSAEVKPFGIRVVLIEPGDLHTQFTAHRIRTPQSQSNPVYRESFRRALETMEKAEIDGPSPEIVAPLLKRIITSSSPRLRYTVGPITERVAVVLKQFLPDRLFERLLMLSYKLSA